MKKKINRFIYWIPRILAIIFLVFIAMFSLDIFDMHLGFWGAVVGLFMHNILTLLLLVGLILSWKKYEIIGGIAFILFGILYIARLMISMVMNNQVQWYALTWSLMIAGPAFLIGILFLIGWVEKRKIKHKTRR